MATPTTLTLRDLVVRFTSRKFILAVVGAVLTVLAAAGVISPDRAVALATAAGPAVFIAVEGIADAVRALHQ